MLHQNVQLGDIVAVPFVWIKELKNVPYINTTMDKGLSELWQEGEGVLYTLGKVVKKHSIGSDLNCYYGVEVFTEPKDPCFIHNISSSEDPEDWRCGYGEEFYYNWRLDACGGYGKYEEIFFPSDVHLINLNLLCGKLLPIEVLAGEMSLEYYTAKQADEEAKKYNTNPLFYKWLWLLASSIMFLKERRPFVSLKVMRYRSLNRLGPVPFTTCIWILYILKMNV